MAYRLNLYCKGLVAEGCRVNILMPRSGNPNNISGKSQNLTYRSIAANSLSSNYILRRLQLWFIDPFLLMFPVKKEAKENNTVWLIGFQGFWLLVYALYFKFSHIRIIIEQNENPYSMQSTSREIVFVRKIKQWLQRNITWYLIDGFVVISESLEYLVKKYASRKSSIIRVPILTDDYQISNSNHVSNFDSIRDIPFILHAGDISERKDGISKVIVAFHRAIQVIGKGKLKFYFTRKNALINDTKLYKKIIEDLGLVDEIFFTDYLSNEDLDFLLKNCLMTIVNKPLNSQNNYNFPTKLTNYLINKVPVIASETGEIPKYFTDKKNALIVKPNDINGIADAIIFLYQNPDKAKQIGNNGFLLAQNVFHYNKHSKKLYGFINKIILN